MYDIRLTVKISEMKLDFYHSGFLDYCFYCDIHNVSTDVYSGLRQMFPAVYIA